MPLRSKSVPPKTPRKIEYEERLDLGDEIEIPPSDEHDKKMRKKKKISSHKSRRGSGSRASNSIANRPEWNNDTHIDGYDDLDDNGKVKRRGEMHNLNGEKSRKQQEEINRLWSESLRDAHHR